MALPALTTVTCRQLTMPRARASACTCALEVERAVGGTLHLRDLQGRGVTRVSWHAVHGAVVEQRACLTVNDLHVSALGAQLARVGDSLRLQNIALAQDNESGSMRCGGAVGEQR